MKYLQPIFEDNESIDLVRMPYSELSKTKVWSDAESIMQMASKLKSIAKIKDTLVQWIKETMQLNTADAQSVANAVHPGPSSSVQMTIAHALMRADSYVNESK